MSQIYKHIFPALLAAMVLAACDNEEGEPSAVRNVPSFTASIGESHTRAFDTTWESGDQIGIFGGGVTNICHSTNGDGRFTVTDPDKQITFETDDSVRFTAYYPYISDLSYNKTKGYNKSNISTTDQTNQKEFDFLWAEGVGSKTSPVVDLKFKHLMSKLTLVFKKDKNKDMDFDFESISTYKLTGIKPKGTIYTDEGSTSTASSPTSSEITANLTINDDEAVTSFILFPQSISNSNYPVKFQIKFDSGATIFCELPIQGQKLEAGFNYQFVITVSRTTITVTSSSINSWSEEDRGEDWVAL